MNQQPLQDVLYRSPFVSWDELQPRCDPLKDKQLQIMDEWMEMAAHCNSHFIGVLNIFFKKKIIFMLGPDWNGIFGSNADIRE